MNETLTMPPASNNKDAAKTTDEIREELLQLLSEMSHDYIADRM